MTVSRWGHKLIDDGWKPEIRIDSAIVESCDFAGANEQCTFGSRGGLVRSFGGLDAAAVSAGGRCLPVSFGVCDRGASLHSHELVLYGATVTVEDLEPPTQPGAGSVPLADGEWHNASSTTVSLPAASDNTGVRQRLAWIGDELVKAWTAPGASAGGCGELNTGVAYTYVTPCAGVRGLNAAMPGEALPLGAVPDGEHTLRLAAVDTGGLETRTPGVQIKIDRTAPAAPICDVGPTSWLSAQSGTVACTPEAASSARAPIVRVDVEVCPGDAGGTCTVTATAPGTPHTATLPEGTTWIRARQVDAAGNVGAWSAARAWRRDRTAPTVALSAPSGAVDDGDELAATAVVSDALAGGTAVLWYSINGGEWRRYGGAVTAKAGHSYRFRATATDDAGNVAVEQVSSEVTVRPLPAPPPASSASPPQPSEAPVAEPPAAPQEAATELPAPTASPPALGAAPVPPLTPAQPSPSPRTSTRRATTALRIRIASRGRGSVTVTGVLDRRATGRVIVTVSAKAGARTLGVSKAASVRSGRFKAVLRLAARMRPTMVRARYGGDQRFMPRSAAKRA